MLAVSLDNLLFFLLIAFAALFQLLSKAVSKSKKESDETPRSPTPNMPPPIRRVPAESDADRIRKFLEALGQPPSSTPPSPVLPRTDIPPRRLAPVQPPPVIPGVWRLPREQRQKPDVTQRESRPPEQPSRFQEAVPPPVPGPLRRDSKFMKPYPVSFSSRRLSRPLAKLTQPRKLSGLPNAQIPRPISSPCSYRNLDCAKQSSFVKF